MAAQSNSSPFTFNWFSPVSAIKGVGPKIATKLEKLEIFTMGDLLLHLPYRYEDRTKVTPIASILPGEPIVLEGNIKEEAVINAGRKKKD